MSAFDPKPTSVGAAANTKSSPIRFPPNGVSRFQGARHAREMQPRRLRLEDPSNGCVSRTGIHACKWIGELPVLSDIRIVPT
jgi:hypothetical protein